MRFSLHALIYPTVDIIDLPLLISNFLMSPNSPNERLHSTPTTIFTFNTYANALIIDQSSQSGTRERRFIMIY